MTAESTWICISWPGFRGFGIWGREGLLFAFLGVFSDLMQFIHIMDPRLYPVVSLGANTSITGHSGQ